MHSVPLRSTLRLILVTSLVALVAVAGCRKKDIAPATAEVQIVLAEPPIVLTTPAPDPTVVVPDKNIAPGDTHDAAIWADVQAFYKLRENAPAWITQRTTSARTAAALAVLQSAPAHGLVPADYGAPQIAELLKALDAGKKDAPDRLRHLADVDVRLTTALFSLGRDVAVGRTSPSRLDPRWKTQRTAPDLVSSLARAAEANLAVWLDGVRPQHPEYASLQGALVGLRERQASGGWPTVGKAAFKKGGNHPSVVALRARLVADGSLAAAPGASASTVYDDEVAKAVLAFQDHHGLAPTGIADAATLAAMNVGIDARIRQVETNLERWRWMPDDFGPRHLLVNIPLYKVQLRENGNVTGEIRVVVGKPDHRTPVFSGVMETVVFSPYWNIPDSIVAGETAPAVAKDARYLARNNIEILRVTSAGTTTVQPSQVNWNDPSELRQLAFRQKPGPKNALGHVKFLFPNQYDVYLHDSPADELFARPGRAFSHGCVRVEEPETLAQAVLRDDPDWPLPKILAAMNAGVEKHVKLKQPLPVHIVYFTTVVDAEGGLHFQPDIYGFDAKQAGTATPGNVTRRD
jgi:murein L,D-transpeptidase YcbB/YkuD